MDGSGVILKETTPIEIEKDDQSEYLFIVLIDWKQRVLVISVECLPRVNRFSFNLSLAAMM